VSEHASTDPAPTDGSAPTERPRRGAGRRRGRRWIPFVSVAAVLAVVVGALVLTGGGDGGGEKEATSTGTTGVDGATPPYLSWTDADPLEAPDCDPATGRIRVPVYGAPNCVPVWDEAGDNGGATSLGVTGDTIRVVVYESQDPLADALRSQIDIEDETTEDEEQALREKFVEAYEAHYETYGRHVEVVPMEATGGNADDAAARADAIRIAEEIEAFAVLGGPTQTNAFADELAARGVLCYCTFSLPNNHYERWAPYIWGTQGTATKLYSHMAEWISRKLVGKPAEFAGPGVQDQQRSFALVQYETPDEAYRDAKEQLLRSFDELDIPLATEVTYILDLGRIAEDAKTMVAKLRESGATSVILGTDPIMPGALTKEATAQGWFPEWIITGAVLTDSTVFGRSYDQEQWQHAYGLSGNSVRLEQEVEDDEPNMYEWHFGERIPVTELAGVNSTGLDFMFRGIHLAGPDLTPETFRDGHFSFLPRLGFETRLSIAYGPSDYWDFDSYVTGDDFMEVWWDPGAEGPDERDVDGVGMMRYVDGGRRHLPGEWDDEVRLFEEEGSVTILRERPEGDRMPAYRHEDEPRG
jgi:hypothetical protein